MPISAAAAGRSLLPHSVAEIPRPIRPVEALSPLPPISRPIRRAGRIFVGPLLRERWSYSHQNQSRRRRSADAGRRRRFPARYTPALVLPRPYRSPNSSPRVSDDFVLIRRFNRPSAYFYHRPDYSSSRLCIASPLVSSASSPAVVVPRVSARHAPPYLFSPSSTHSRSRTFRFSVEGTPSTVSSITFYLFLFVITLFCFSTW